MIKRNDVDVDLNQVTEVLTEILEAAFAARTTLRKLNATPLQTHVRNLYALAAGTPSLLAILGDEVLYGRFLSGLTDETIQDLRLLYGRLTVRVGSKGLQAITEQFAEASVVHYTNPGPTLSRQILEELKAAPYLLVLLLLEHLTLAQVRRAGCLS
jgi:hypothetical protein